MNTHIICTLVCLLWYTNCTVGDKNKYSKDANSKKAEHIDLRPVSLKQLDRPFRIAKLNLLWSKAVLRLPESNLQSIFSEIKLLDQKQMAWKHSQREDRNGSMAANFVRDLLSIIGNYGLHDLTDVATDNADYSHYKAFNDASEKHAKTHKQFKDKKLNKLWEKAERSGFTLEELTALHAEFDHHQDTVDRYYALLHSVKEGASKEIAENNENNSIDDQLDRFNRLDAGDFDESTGNNHHLDKVNLLRDSHNTLKHSYNKLEKLAAQGPLNREFTEPKVQGLWKVALEANFTSDELESLRTELKHYEVKLKKLSHMQVEAALNEEMHNKKAQLLNTKPNGQVLMDNNIKKSARKVEKLHIDLESRIMEKHSEL